MINHAIRAPYYTKNHDEGVEFADPDKGIQWGADVIPALMDLFQIERDTRDDRHNSWAGFARHWRGGTLQLDFDLFYESEASDPILVVTTISG